MTTSIPSVRVLLTAVLLAVAVRSAALAEDAQSTPELRLPPDIIYNGASASPGAVVFSHPTHVMLAEHRCVACHPALFPILRPTHTITHEQMNAGKQCGGCHDGTKAIGVQDDCSHCHRSGDQP